MTKRIYTLLIYILFFAAAYAQNMAATGVPFADVVAPKREVRAVWLTTIGGLDWPHSYAQGTRRSIEKQQKELTDILDKLRAAGVNTVLLQTRVRGTVIYPSAFEPFDGCLSGKPGISPGYDALQFAIDECHKRGMEIHAWVVTIPVGKWNGKGCATLRKKYGTLIKKIGEDGYMNPEDARTASIIGDVCEEITRQYDVDGIHLDYIRYPEEWKAKVQKSKGRDYITNIVRHVHRRVKKLKPWVKMSCSPIGKSDDLPRQWSRGWNAHSRVMQDAQGWMREGLMDILFPMMYFKGDNFYPFALDWQEQSHGRMVVPGLGIYFMSPREKNWSLQNITQEMHVLRQWGMGHAYFRSKFFTDNLKGIYNYAKNSFDNTTALVPPMTWECDKAPFAPNELSVDSLRSTISWSGAVDRSGANSLTYNIYSSVRYPVDTENAANLMLARVSADSVIVPLNGRYYAVCAMDRYGNESAPRQQKVKGRYLASQNAASKNNVLPQSADNSLVINQQSFGPSSTLLPVFEIKNGRAIIGSVLANETDLVQVETPTGTVQMTVFGARSIDVSALAPGFYVLRSISRKGANHKLGFLKVESGAVSSKK